MQIEDCESKMQDKDIEAIHFRIDPLSLYILINRNSVDDAESQVKRIRQYVVDSMLG